MRWDPAAGPRQVGRNRLGGPLITRLEASAWLLWSGQVRCLSLASECGLELGLQLGEGSGSLVAW